MATRRKTTRRRRRRALGRVGKTVSCKTTRVKGQGLRRICRDSRGRITSNKKASTTRRRRRR